MIPCKQTLGGEEELPFKSETPLAEPGSSDLLQPFVGREGKEERKDETPAISSSRVFTHPSLGIKNRGSIRFCLVPTTSTQQAWI